MAMSLLRCSVVLSFLWISQCFAEEYIVENNVLVLNDDSFAQAVKDHDLLLVEFYAPWCGHCKKLAPEWEYAAATLAKENASAKLAKVDSVESRALYKKYDIKSFPTIIFFKNQQRVLYNGARTAEAIVSWVKRHSTTLVTALDTIDDFISAHETHDVMVLGYFPDLSSNIMQRKRGIFHQIAETIEYLSFFETSEESWAVYMNLLDEGTIDEGHIFIFKSFDKHISLQPLQLDRKLVTEKVMTEYIKHNSYELFPKFSRESAKRIFAPRIETHGWVVIDPYSVDYEDQSEVIYYLANQFKGRVQFIQLPSYEEGYIKQFDVNTDDIPALILMDTKTMTQYKYNGLFELSQLSQYTADVLNGSAVRHRKSEATTPEDTTGSVIILRASSFLDLVKRDDRNMLIFFYASWCGHCQSFTPVFDALAEHYKSAGNFVFAKIDAIENDIDDIMDGIRVESFPTLYHISGPSNNRKATLYDGSRELTDLIEHINSQDSIVESHPEL